MDNPFQIFTSPIFGSVRATLLDDKAYFIAKDVCKVLGLGNVSRAASKLNRDEKRYCSVFVHSTLSNMEVERKMLAVTEEGLYRLVMRSRKAVACEFQDWVCREVLPSIRKTGSYSLFAQLDSDDAVHLEVPSSPPLIVARELIEVARLMEPSPERNKILLHAANLIAGKNIF